MPRIDNVHSLLTAFEAVSDEWQQDAVLVSVAVEKGTDVALFAQNRTPYSNRPVGSPRIATLVRSRLQILAPDGDLGEPDFNPNQLAGQFD